MKARLLPFCFALLFAADTVRAQYPPPAPGPVLAQHPPPGFHPDPIGENLFPPELIMSHQEAIGLTPDQKSYLRDEIRKAQLRFTDLQWQLQDSMETLGSLLKGNSVDEQAILAQLEKVLDAEREIKRTQLTLMARIKNKLTPQQQTRLRELRSASPTPPPWPRPPGE